MILSTIYRIGMRANLESLSTWELRIIQQSRSAYQLSPSVCGLTHTRDCSALAIRLCSVQRVMRYAMIYTQREEVIKGRQLPFAVLFFFFGQKRNERRKPKTDFQFRFCLAEGTAGGERQRHKF